MNSNKPENSPLPKNWVYTTLGNVRLDNSKNITPLDIPEEKFELYSVPSFDNKKPELLDGFNIGSSKRTVADQAVLLCKINPRINRVWIVGQFSEYLKIASTEWIPFFPLDGIEPRYLAYFLQETKFRSYLTVNVSGVGGSLMRIKPSTIQDYPFPLPPLNEQHRIVAKIEELFSHLDAGIQALEKTRALLKQYRQSVLQAAVTGELTREWRKTHQEQIEPADQLLKRLLQERRKHWEAQELAHMRAKGKEPKNDQWKEKYKEPPPPETEGLPELPEGWVWAKVQQLGAIGEQTVLTGPFGTNLGREDFVDKGVPVLTIGCLTPDGLTFDKAMYVTASKANELERYKLKTGDLLFSRMASVGRAGLVNQHFEDSIFNYHIMRLRLAEDTIKPLFFVSYVQAAAVASDYVKEVNHGATRDGINTAQLLEMPVAIPPILEQEQILKRLDESLSITKILALNLTNEERRTQKLRQSILQQAFTGKLVPQDPNDEPASILLEHIQAEKAKQQAEVKSRPKKKRKPMKPKIRRPLLEVLKEAERSMKPEELLDQAGFDHELIEEFYQELKEAIGSQQVIEERPNTTDVFLKAG